jgi:hypothetical protein
VKAFSGRRPEPASAPVPAPADPSIAEADGHLESAWVAAVAVVTATWVAATVAGGELPLLATNPRGTAAGAAAAALAGVGWRPRTRASALAAGAGLVLLPLAVAAAAGGSAVLLAALLTATAGAETVITQGTGPTSGRHTATYALGVAAAAASLAAALLVERGEGGSWSLPADNVTAAGLGLLAATLLVVVATLGPLRARPLAVPGLLVGLVAVTGLSPLGASAVGAVAASAWAFRRPQQPTLTLAALAVAAAALPVGRQPSALLAAAAALALVVRHPATALLGLPGGAGLAASLVSTEPEPPLVVLVAGTAAAALVLGARGAREPRGRWGEGSTGTEGIFGLVPAGALALWLVVSPGSWGWTGAEGLGDYDRGALVATAAAGLALVGRRAMAVRPTAGSPPEPATGADAR